MTIGAILRERTGAVISAGPTDTVRAAVDLLAQNWIGAVPVVENEKILGIFSERDYARKVILQGKASKSTKVSEIMTGKVVYVTLNRTVEECMAIMTEKHFRHLPVLDDDHNVVGIVSIGDLIKEMISQQKFIIDQLENYITG